MSWLTRIRVKLGRLRPLLVARGILNLPRLWRNRAHYRRLGLRRSVVRTLRQDMLPAGSEPGPWLDRPDAAERLAQSTALGQFDAATREGLRAWPERGYLALEGFYAPELIDRINSELDQLIAGGTLRFNRGGARVRDAYRKSAAVAGAVEDLRLRRLLGFILGTDVGVWQTISFFTGSTQGAHSDSFHMTTEPSGYLIAIWVALEDVEPGCGPVYYLPGSHRLPYVMTQDLEGAAGSALMVADKRRPYAEAMRRVVGSAGIEPEQFLARKGDVLVWHANLLHGGGPITDPESTRRSLVAHFYGKGCLRYSEVGEQPSLR